MKYFLTGKRASGILAHITSLPSPHGIGDIGYSSYRFIDFLEQSGQHYWQFLPTGPTSLIFDNSPYMSCSAFAGSPLLISCELLAECGLVDWETLNNSPDFPEYTVDFDKLISYKQGLLDEAFSKFNPEAASGYQTFITQTEWLEDYALFMAIKRKYPNQGWLDWPEDIARHDLQAISALKKKLQSTVDYYRFEQFEFHRQWQILRKKAEEKNIKLIGDIPIYVSLDSADVWANQDIFDLDPLTRLPTHVGGVPPDYFSSTGQRWGNPLYQWQKKDKETKERLFTWWKKRFHHTFQLVDISRIDHFRGFADYWSIDAEEETAINGDWLPGPGHAFFTRLFKEMGQLNIIAEDLGIINQKVIQLRDSLNFPGMKILQFAFDDNPDNSFLPHNYTTSNCVVYTGTHDNETSLGWFLGSHLNDNQRIQIKEYANRSLHDPSPIHKDLIYIAFSSIAALAIIPLQDVLGYGNDCRMNTPSTSSGNWRWRCPAHALNNDVSSWLKKTTKLLGRNRRK